MSLYLLAIVPRLFDKPLAKSCWIKDGSEQQIFVSIRFILYPELKPEDGSILVGNKMIIEKNRLGVKRMNNVIKKI